MATPGVAALAQRLRQLRAGVGLTQPQLGAVLGVGASSVSSWESASAGKLPPPRRLAGYARFFATPRSLAGSEPRLLSVEELTDEENAEQERLASELLRLHHEASDTSTRRGGLWQFGEGEPVRIICGQLDPHERPHYAAARDRNYMQLASYADLDALVELFGHVRVQNPSSDVGFELASRLEHDDLQAHLVVLGGLAVNQVTAMFVDLAGLPVTQLADPTVSDGEIFVFPRDPPARFGPRFAGGDPSQAVIEDVGLFLRAANPYNSVRTLTLCSGVFTRGVYGAVRCLTDAAVRDRNERYVAERFAGEETFAVLMRVPVLDHATATPDLTKPHIRLHEWPARS